MLGVDHGLFEDALEDMKDARGIIDDVDLCGDDLETLVGEYLDIVRAETGEDFPADPKQQLWVPSVLSLAAG